jgi:hypothetical protein
MALRPATESDRRFVVNSWFESYRPHVDAGFDVFAAGHRRHMDALFASTDAPVVAADLEDPNVILGWALLNPTKTHLHYAYVKHPFRRLGVARLLVPPTVKWYTFRTPAGVSLAKVLQLRYDPWGALVPR